MVKLFIHCGYHKTGSSYLQSLFALNRKILMEDKIYFPKSKEEREMISGNISPGNGMELVNAIREKDQNKIVDILKRWGDDTVRIKCEKLLISSEGLFHVLASKELMELFTNSCKNVGIENINALLFFRDPVSHAFSVYKHRGKRGGIPDYENWLKHKYETLELTESFLSFYKEFNINWTFRKYKSDSNFMSKATFEDWLGVKIPDKKLNSRVNISLTLSEIAMITEVKDLLPQNYLTDIHAKLSKLPKSKKANDLDLQKYYKEISNKVLYKYSNVINDLNEILPKEESLVLEVLSENIENHIEIISLSRDQIKVFTQSIGSNNSLLKRMVFNTQIFFAKFKRKLS